MKRLPYYLEKFDPEKAEPFEVENEPFVVWAADGTRIEGFLLEGPGLDLYVVAHGLLGHSRAPGYRQFVESLSRYGPVIAVDLRGHGISAGSSTLGNKEALDVAAITKEAKALDRWSTVTLIGFSMGAAAAIRAAALYEPCDSVVAISSPAEWHGRRRWAAHRTALIWKVPGGTFLMHMVTGVRIEPVWQESESPVSVVPKLAPSSLLIVHGGSDQFFPPQEARDLYDRAAEPKGIWEIPDAGHAEGIFVDQSKNVDMADVHWFVDQIVERSRRLSTWR